MQITINSIKENMENHLGKPIEVTAQTGRKRQSKRRGILKEVYPSLFVVELNPEENKFEKASYSFSDILTKSVEVDFIVEDGL